MIFLEKLLKPRVKIMVSSNHWKNESKFIFYEYCTRRTGFLWPQWFAVKTNIMLRIENVFTARNILNPAITRMAKLFPIDTFWSSHNTYIVRSDIFSVIFYFTRKIFLSRRYTTRELAANKSKWGYNFTTVRTQVHFVICWNLVFSFYHQRSALRNMAINCSLSHIERQYVELERNSHHFRNSLI
jgi:hypothetical protein